MEGAPKKEKFPFPLDLENREEVESKLKEAQHRLSDLEYDDKNGTYPGGVPIDAFNDARGIVENLERALDVLNRPRK